MDKPNEYELEMFRKADVICPPEYEELIAMSGMTWQRFDAECAGIAAVAPYVMGRELSKRAAALCLVMRRVYKKQWDAKAREWVTVEKETL